MNAFIKTLTFLNKKYPFFYANKKTNLMMAFFASIFVLHTSLIFSPGIIFNNIHTDHVIASIVYSFITFFTFIIGCELPTRIFKNWYKEWKVYKEMVLSMSCISTMGTLNYGYIFFFGHSDFKIDYFAIDIFFSVVLTTLVSGFVPLLIITLFNLFRLEKIKSNSIKIPTPPIVSKVQPSQVLLINEGNEIFDLDLNGVSIIESMGNYVKIYQNHSTTNNVIIKRVTMKRVEELLIGQNSLVRAHRSFFINLSHIEGMHKSESGDLCLMCSNLNVVVPVSRAKRKEFYGVIKMQTD